MWSSAVKRLVLLAVLGLAGCASGGNTPDRLAAQDDASCVGYGAPLGSDAYAQCIEQRQLDRFQDFARPSTLMFPSSNPFQ